jgi:hypothetical protein
VRHRHFRRHRRAHVEQGKAEGWRQEGRLQVHRQQDHEPDHEVLVLGDMRREIDLGQNGGEDRQHDQADLEEVEEEPHDEDQHHHEDQDLPAAVDAGRLQQLGDHIVAAQRAEHEGEQGCAEDDEEHQPVGQRRTLDHFL